MQFAPTRIHTSVEARMTEVSAAYNRLVRYTHAVFSQDMRTKAINALQELDDALDKLENELRRY